MDIIWNWFDQFRGEPLNVTSGECEFIHVQVIHGSLWKQYHSKMSNAMTPEIISVKSMAEDSSARGRGCGWDRGWYRGRLGGWYEGLEKNGPGFGASQYKIYVRLTKVDLTRHSIKIVH